MTSAKVHLASNSNGQVHWTDLHPFPDVNVPLYEYPRIRPLPQGDVGKVTLWANHKVVQCTYEFMYIHKCMRNAYVQCTYTHSMYTM